MHLLELFVYELGGDVVAPVYGKEVHEHQRHRYEQPLDEGRSFLEPLPEGALSFLIGLYDEEHSRKTYGKSVVRRFYDMGILKDNSIAVHCNHISEDDMDLIAERKTTVIHNPESNMGNAVGAPDMITMMDKGILVGLGTDGYTNDMMESLKVANILQKHRRGLPDRGFLEACRMCFDNNAAIASDIIGERYGAIEAGLPADVILVDYHPVTPLTGDNVNGHLMFGVNGAMTDTTIINGKVLMRHRKLVQADEEQILSKSREAAAALWKKL